MGRGRKGRGEEEKGWEIEKGEVMEERGRERKKRKGKGERGDGWKYGEGKWRRGDQREKGEGNRMKRKGGKRNHEGMLRGEEAKKKGLGGALESSRVPTKTVRRGTPILPIISRGQSRDRRTNQRARRAGEASGSTSHISSISDCN